MWKFYCLLHNFPQKKNIERDTLQFYTTIFLQNEKEPFMTQYEHKFKVKDRYTSKIQDQLSPICSNDKMFGVEIPSKAIYSSYPMFVICSKEKYNYSRQVLGMHFSLGILCFPQGFSSFCSQDAQSPCCHVEDFHTIEDPFYSRMCRDDIFQ